MSRHRLTGVRLLSRVVCLRRRPVHCVDCRLTAHPPFAFLVECSRLCRVACRCVLRVCARALFHSYMARSRPAGAFHRSARAAAEEMSGNGNGGGGGRSPTGTAKKSVSPLEGLLFKRMRSSSLTGLPVRRRKGDFFRDVIRSIRDIASWSGGLKVGLFLLLAGTMWMVIAIFATTDEHNQHASRDPTQRMTPLEEATAGITAAAASAALDGPIEPTIVRATVLRTFAHDPSAFTQGLLVDDGIFWEGTGLYGQSEVRRVSLESGEVLDSFKIPYAEFGEGITMFNDKIFQITWREHKGYVYHANNFTLGPSQTWTYRMEGC